MKSSIALHPNATVTAAHLDQFQQHGYFVLESVLSTEQLQLLRDRVSYHVGRIDGIMEERGVTTLGLNHKGNRYFVSAHQAGDPEVGRFIFSDLMAEITSATLGEEVFLFIDQYVVKAAEKGAHFSWHQDSGYLGYDHKPYLTCWITLDDVSEENGTVYVLPFDRAGTRDRVDHVQDPEFNDLVGYFGEDRGIPVIAPAGSIAVFYSTVFHRSGPNTTDNMRRIYLAQYSGEVILKEDGSGPWGMAEPFLSGGQRVDAWVDKA